MCLNTTYNSVLTWAQERDLIKGSLPKDQLAKLVEEMGELAGHIARGKDVKDDIGDCIVVLTILAAQHGLTLSECYSHSYGEIKDRKGKMVDGVFVKEGV